MPHLTPKTLSAQARLAFQDDGPTARCDRATSRRVTASQDVCWPGLETTRLPCRPSLRGRDDSIPRAMASRQVATYRLVRHDLTHATQRAPFPPASGCAMTKSFRIYCHHLTRAEPPRGNAKHARLGSVDGFVASKTPGLANARAHATGARLLNYAAPPRAGLCRQRVSLVLHRKRKEYRQTSTHTHTHGHTKRYPYFHSVRSV